MSLQFEWVDWHERAAGLQQHEHYQQMFQNQPHKGGTEYPTQQTYNHKQQNSVGMAKPWLWHLHDKCKKKFLSWNMKKR